MGAFFAVYRKKPGFSLQSFLRPCRKKGFPLQSLARIRAGIAANGWSQPFGLLWRLLRNLYGPCILVGSYAKFCLHLLKRF
jgi:hypothetical protein